MKKYISGELIAYHLAVKLCELNGWPSDYNSDQRTTAEIQYRESIERGIAAGRIKPYNPITFTVQDIVKRDFESATFSEKEVMDYLNSESGGDARQQFPEPINAAIESTRTKTPAPLFGDGFSEEAQKITTLTKYLELETWTPIEAAMLVCGLQPPQDCLEIPQGAMGLDNALVMPNSDRFHYAKRVLQLWNSRENPPYKIRPADFVAWCNSKGINTDWLRDIEATAALTKITRAKKTEQFDLISSGKILELAPERAVEWLSRACWSIGEVHWLLYGFEPVRKTITAFPPPANAGDDVEKLDRAILAGHLAPLNPGNGESCYAPADVIRVAEAIGFGCWQTWKNMIEQTQTKVVQDIPGIIPRVASCHLAVLAAFEIECETGRRATARLTMKRLQKWADEGKHGELIKSLPDNSVEWMTTKHKANKFDLEACGKALERWNKSRQ